MAKSTKGRSKKAQEPVIAEEIAQDANDASVEDVTDTPIEDAEILSSEGEADSSEAVVETETLETDGSDTDIDIADTLDTADTSTPEVVRETVVERKGGFLPLVFGGIVAAGIGVVGSQYIFPNGLPFGPAATQRINLESALKLQTGRIDDLTKQLESAPSIDTSPYDAAVSAVGDLQAQIGAVVDNVGALDTRIAELEALPRQDGSGISTAMENELKDLRAALDLQKGELAQMIDEAQDTKQSAEDTARDTLARAAVTRILVALESGAPFEDALANVQANSDIAMPEVLSQTAKNGVPTLASLGETYPDAARASLAAVRSEDTGGGVASFFAKQLGARSVAPREGDDPDAVLSRVGAAVNEGRIEDALALTEMLPDAAKAPLADWTAQANLRLSAAREAEALANSLNSQ